MGAYTFQTVNTAVRGSGDLTPTHSGTAGRLALCFCAAGNAASETGIATPSGWTLLSARGGPHTAIFGRVLTGGDANPLIDFQVSASHFAQIAEFSGNVYTDLATIVHAEADAFSGTATVPAIPNITISQANCLVIIAGWHNKTATSNGSTYDPVSGFTEIAEDRADGTQIDWVWNYQQQTTATSLSGLTRTMTGTTESSSATGLSVALLSASAGGILRQMMNYQ